jgi:AcrR family transcriptional regulator
MPRRPEQFEQIREKSREKILSAALDLFANKGYDATSIDSIAKKAGISKGLIYNYFESKKSILLAIFNDAMKMGEEMVMGQINVKDPLQRKKAIIELTFDMINKRPEYMKLLTVMALQPGVMAETKEFTKNVYKKTEEWGKIITGKGKREAVIESLMIGAMMDGITLNFIMYGEQYPLEELKKEIIKVYCTPQPKSKK